MGYTMSFCCWSCNTRPKQNYVKHTIKHNNNTNQYAIRITHPQSPLGKMKKKWLPDASTQSECIESNATEKKNKWIETIWASCMGNRWHTASGYHCYCEFYLIQWPFLYMKTQFRSIEWAALEHLRTIWSIIRLYEWMRVELAHRQQPTLLFGVSFYIIIILLLQFVLVLECWCCNVCLFINFFSIRNSIEILLIVGLMRWRCNE